MFCVPFEYYREELPFNIDECDILFIALKQTALDFSDLRVYYKINTRCKIKP
jgi:hypothetical protein